MTTPTNTALVDLIHAANVAADKERHALIAFGQGSPEAHAAWLESSAAHRAMVEAFDAAEVAS